MALEMLRHTSISINAENITAMIICNHYNWVILFVEMNYKLVLQL